MVTEIYQIFSDLGTLKFLPQKRLQSVNDAEAWLKSTILNFHCGRNFLHSITDKRSGNVLGMIDIFTPATIKEYYQLQRPSYFIEFYLRSSAQGRRIMSNLLPQIMNELEMRGIDKVGAIINDRNFAAKNVLTKAGFSYICQSDKLQGLYCFNAYEAESALRYLG